MDQLATEALGRLQQKKNDLVRTYNCLMQATGDQAKYMVEKEQADNAIKELLRNTSETIENKSCEDETLLSNIRLEALKTMAFSSDFKPLDLPTTDE